MLEPDFYCCAERRHCQHSSASVAHKRTRSRRSQPNVDPLTQPLHCLCPFMPQVAKRPGFPPRHQHPLQAMAAGKHRDNLGPSHLCTNTCIHHPPPSSPPGKTTT